ncbi:MAG: TrbC family F-type conjugative pilus assembly protein (plasmid) [Candidatus Manganitrophus sp.]|nr:TrbC family F-type conjugative pilus assembly protein [Candidatus Manganitrophus sp.]MDC4228339.1 TrbC family F-type conjugative pilus assembly protein [Candidatus Manganitrophus sp.]WDT73408.1 MAG: TrbC family F-type conjugative pilus assembly protein [Candidatus Manganitrophus sp.]
MRSRRFEQAGRSSADSILSRRGLLIIILSLLLLAVFIFGWRSEAGGEGRAIEFEPQSGCDQIEAIEGESIYLRSASFECDLAAGKLTARLDPSVEVIRIYVNGKFWRAQYVGSNDPESLRRSMNEANIGANRLTVPENLTTREMEELAGRSVDRFRSDETQDRIKRGQEAIGRRFHPDASDSLNREIPARPPAGILPSSERIYLFISSSLPQETLRTYAAALARLHDPNIVMVLRGYVGGMKRSKPLQEFAMGILLKDPDCLAQKTACERFSVRLEIDPNLFRRYNIHQVPALVYVPSIRVSEDSGGEGLIENAEVGTYYHIDGDASFEFLIGQIQEKSRSGALRRIATALQSERIAE